MWCVGDFATETYGFTCCRVYIIHRVDPCRSTFPVSQKKGSEESARKLACHRVTKFQ